MNANLLYINMSEVNYERGIECGGGERVPPESFRSEKESKMQRECETETSPHSQV